MDISTKVSNIPMEKVNTNNNANNPLMKKWEALKAEDPTKKRNFQIRVHIIEARELQPRDSNGMSDPVCIVHCLGKKMNTKKYSNTTICTWDHLMFFEFNLLPDEFFTNKVRVGVYDANTVLRDVMIGCYEFDIATIYEQDGHEYFRKWVALTDVTGKKEGVQGYLKLSITVLGPQDQAPAHSEEEEQDDEQEGADLQSLVLLPPTIKTEQYSLELNIYRAESLPKMDTIGKCDAYVSVRFGGNAEIKTEVIKNSFAPTWNEKLIIPVTCPTMTDIIKVQVVDWDAVGKNETVASFFLKFSEIMAGTRNWKLAQWYNLYGTPEGVDADPITKTGKLAAKMNDGYVDGCAFRGRLLMGVELQKINGMKLSKHKINPVSDPAQENYVLRCDLMEAAELQTKAKIAIEVAVGSHRIESKKMKVENGSASWYTAMEEVQLSLPKERDQMPDIFIDIMKHSKSGLKKKKRIGYIRIKLTDLNNAAPAKWELIQNDVFQDSDNPDAQIIGFLYYRVQLGLARELGNREVVQKPKMKQFHLRAHIYQGRELPAADANGLSDPYIVVRVGKYQAKTKIVKKTIYPLWYETLQIPIEVPENLAMAPDVNVAVWDWDQLDGDDYLGRFSVPLSSISEKFQDAPKWHSIYRRNTKIIEGEILASFQLIPEDKLTQFPVKDITPKYKDCIVEVAVIGLRDLLPYRLLPITKPYVEVDCGGDTILKTKISDQPSGKSPNFLEVLSLDVKVPVSRLFAPPLNIRVYDDRVLYKALVATRSISLSPFIKWEDPIPDPLSVDVNVGLDEDDDGKKRQINAIPGAKDTKEEPVAEQPVKLIQLEDDTPDDPKTENDKKNSDIKGQLMKFVNTAAPSKVKESFLPGMEAEPEEKKPERESLKNELEFNLKETPFTIYKLYRTKTQGINGKRIKVETGTFKGKLRVYEKAKKNEVEPAPNLVEMYKPRDFVVRAYILEGFQLVPKDMDGKNNPYIRIKCGDQKIKDINDMKQGTNRPQFYKHYEIPVNFPGKSTLDVAIYDHDKIGSDELIGNTIIDLENRIFSNEWKSQKFHPIEFRTLWCPSSSNPQGQVKLWVDILTPEEAKNSPPEPIAPPTPMQYELRVIVWETKEVVFKDKKMSDIFVVGYPEGADYKPQNTDTHWRSEDGTGKFNWRMKFNIIVPNTNPRFKLQIWDKDLLNPNDAIAECNLNLRSFYNKMYKNKHDRESMEKQWIAMTHPAFEGVQGKVLVSFELLTLEEAKRSPAGFGRKEPNENPHLAEPERPNSFNPLRVDKYMSKVVWGQNKFKIIAACTCICCCIFFIMMFSFLSTFHII